MMSKFGVPTEEQLAKINKLAKRTLSADEVFAFSGKSAGDMLIPNRFTRISKELLQVMADDAKKGVSFMLNHNWSSWGGIQGIPYGKVFDGELKVSLEDNEATELHLSKYIVRDDEIVDGVSANALIKRIETGILSDTSVTFSTDTMVCSICGKNYFSRECSHWRGAKYEMEDGTTKTCTVTAMPPSIIIPYNNNALYEESIVWDGAYPGAMVSQAKDGDIIELPTGNFAVLGDKEELPDNTAFLNKYHNGNILTMVKKSDHKKVHNLGGIDEGRKEGVKKLMNEKLQKMLKDFGMSVEETEKLTVDDASEILNQLAEKWDNKVEEIKASVEPVMAQLDSTEEFLSKETVKEKLGTELTADNVLNLAKEGQEYRKQLIDDTIAMGVRAMGNEFKAETWKVTLSTMESSAIKDIMANFETQAKNNIPNGRQTDANAGMGVKVSPPDEAFKVGK
jgi:hypothetical protein